MFKKFYILHFTFYIIITPLLLVILSCTTSTDVSKGSLIGSVALENETDHSGISVSLYELAYLDTTITRINNEYPHIGVIINQHTEFDHRMQTPIKTGTTAADGSFELKNIPTGIYNFVAQKAGYGFRYIHEISISEGENLLSEELKIKNVNPVKYASHFTGQESKMKKPVISTGMEKSNSSRGTLSNNSKLRIQNSTLTLFPELHLSGEISEEIVVEPYHHLVCDDDVTFVPGSRLEIQPNAVVRIAPGADLTIMGNFKAQGEEDNMFWVTSNAGFENDELLMFNSKLEENYVPKNNSKLRIKNLKLIGDSLALYNSMQLSPLATVENDVIEWGKWDWGNTCLLNQVDNLTLQNGIFRNGSCGFYSNNVEITNCSKLIAMNCWGESEGGAYFNNVSSGSLEKNIILNCYHGIKIKNYSNPVVKNNFMLSIYDNLQIRYYSCPTIINNDLNISNIGVLIGISSCPNIIFNNFTSKRCIKIIWNYESDIIEVKDNNFNYTVYSFEIVAQSYADVNANENYFYTTSNEEISNSIFDKNDVEQSQQQYYSEVFYEPFLTQKCDDAGIQGE